MYAKIRIRRAALAACGIAATCGAAVLLQWPGQVSATPANAFASEVTRAFFESIKVTEGNGRYGSGAGVKIAAREPTDVYVVTNTVAPGGYSGWHTHPGPSIVLVKAGTATVYDGDDPGCTPMQYPAGTGFVDQGGTHVHMIRNEGPTPLVTVAFQMIPAGAVRRVDAPAPGYCGF